MTCRLWQVMGQFEKALLAIGGFVVVTSLVGLVSVLLTLQAQRRREMAILRATGASPALIASLYSLESLGLALLSCLLAVVLGALGITALSPWLLEHYGLQLGLRALNTDEWAVLGSVPLAALLVSLAPAISSWLTSRRQGFGGFE